MNEVNMKAIAQETIDFIDNKRIVEFEKLMNNKIYLWRG